MMTALFNLVLELLRENSNLRVRIAVLEERSSLADQRAANAELAVTVATKRAELLEQSTRMLANSLQQNHNALAQLALQHVQRERALNRRAS